MQDPTAVVHRRIDQGVDFAAIFRLQMKCESSEFEIGVVPEDHGLHSLPAAQFTCRRHSSGRFAQNVFRDI